MVLSNFYMSGKDFWFKFEKFGGREVGELGVDILEFIDISGESVQKLAEFWLILFLLIVHVFKQIYNEV